MPPIGRCEERLMRRRHVTESGCWEWTGAKTSAGYGQIRNGKGVWLYTHRVAAEVLAGLDVNGHVVLHTCDNPPCFNPSHLHVGSHGDNVRDKMSKGRQIRGEQTPIAKLTDETALEALEMLRAGAYRRQVAAHFGVGYGTITALADRRTWRHVGTLDPVGRRRKVLLDAYDQAHDREAQDG